MNNEQVIILGSGPAGLTAAMFIARAGITPVVFDGMESGGQLLQTQHVANYPGVAGTVPGEAIISVMRKQAEQFGARFVMDEAISVAMGGGQFPVAITTLLGDRYCARALLVATGAGVRKTGKPGEMQFFGRGISACLTCDGAFYKGKRVAIIGEGPSVKGAGAYLARLGAEIAATVAPAELKEFVGADGRLGAVALVSGETIEVAGAFLVTGRTPQTAFLNGTVALDNEGYIVTRGQVHTSCDAILAAGDCIHPKHKQAVIAAGDGATAALEIISMLSR